MNLLFVCSANRLRSPTAEALFSQNATHVASSAGADPDAETPVSADLIEWADIVFPMERAHLRRLNRRFPVQMRHKRTIVLNVQDDYDFMDPALIDLLRSRLRKHIEL